MSGKEYGGLYAVVWNVAGESHARCALVTEEELRPFAARVAQMEDVVDGSIMVGRFKEIPATVRPPRMVPAEVVIGIPVGEEGKAEVTAAAPPKRKREKTPKGVEAPVHYDRPPALFPDIPGEA